MTGNVIRFSSGLSAEGGGIFAEVAVMLAGTPVARNSPDPQCVGCDISGAGSAQALGGEPPVADQPGDARRTPPVRAWYDVARRAASVR